MGKPTRGVVLIATNNGTYDYEKLADFAGERASQKLNLPYTVITAEERGSEYHRVFDDGQRGQFFNIDHARAWAASPYDVTLYIDADFIVNTDSLAVELEQFEASSDPVRFLTKKHVKHLELAVQNPCSIWSTVFLYKKKPATELFELVTRLADNWMFVRESHRLGHLAFRNDVALNIAADKLLPNLPSLSQFYACEFQRDPWRGEHRALDTHALHKTSLMDWYLSGQLEASDSLDVEEAAAGSFTTTIIR